MYSHAIFNDFLFTIILFIDQSELYNIYGKIVHFYAQHIIRE